MTISGINSNTVNMPDDGFWTKAKIYAKSLFSGSGIFWNAAQEGSKSGSSSKEIPLIRDISDEQINSNNERSKYIKVTQSGNYTVQAGDNPSKIAAKYGIQTATLLAYNGMNEKSSLKIGQVVKIPPTKTPKNINSIQDVAKAMGVSSDFLLKLKRIEDGPDKKDNQFWNYTYDDATGKKSDGKNVKGTETIGIGHVWKKGEPRFLNNKQVLELFTKDLIKAEDNLIVLVGGQKNYDKLPSSMKEALLDMTFNKGTDIIKNSEGLLWCLKNGKYEAAINKMTNNKSAKTGKELSGLSKRRLLDIATASKMYKGNIPQSVLNTAQQVYNRGIQLLRKEFPQKADFEAQLAGYNKDVKTYWGNKIKLTEK